MAPERASNAKFDALVDMLRHADTSTTHIYAKVVNKMQENPAGYLEAMLTAQGRRLAEKLGNSP